MSMTLRKSVAGAVASVTLRHHAVRSFHTRSFARHAASASPSASSSSLPSAFSPDAGAIRMRGLIATSPSDPLQLHSLTLRAPRSDEVVVKLVASGLCHTDVAVKERNLCSFPMVLGHEGAGIIERVGSSVRSLAVGDHVLLSYASCGSCPHCALGKPAYCFEHGSENFGGRDTGAREGDGCGSTRHRDSETGSEVFGSFFRQSSFAEYALATENNVVKVDRKHDLATLSPLGCGIQTGTGAVLNTLRPPVGSRLAVFGSGAVGLSAVMAARLSGCREIVAVDRSEYRLKLAKELGATRTIQVTGKESSKEVVERIRGEVPAGFEFSIDTSGVPSVLRSAFDILNPLGVAGLIGGAAPGVEVGIDMLNLLPGKQLRGIIQGDSNSKTFLPMLIDMHERGLFPFEKMIKFYEGLEATNQAIEEVKNPEANVIKPVIRIAKQ